ncbi:phospholipase D-like domain-containing protein [Nocardioides sp. Arc9.136]|uniref:phospholipase D-like domain-containing protein n=1 Tax=Nocardioides sp. Arc9.136 TaxID=2996826 RepID=UPI0026655FEB|nr:phospholipase D-like domain-containing protein [Nocardioides sp. Arc9.136]WKN47537.1 phospholipase D-like domain-containing protein [Nocardioides sp. Arc9.136]
MRRLSAATVLTTSLLLVAGLLGALPTSASAAPDRARAATAAAPAAKPKPAPLRYTPDQGVRVNNPLGDAAARRRIIGHLLRTIQSVPGQEKIRVASWNVRSDDIANALIAAHRRGVSVRVVMDRLNANKSNVNEGVNRMQAAFKKNEANRSAAMRSDVRKCVSSCRNRGGIAHTKFFLFSKAGKAKNVVIYGSNNATDLAAYGQWNDVYTITGKAGIYGEFEHVFDQMRRDKPVKQAYESHEHGKYTSYFYPYRGKGAEADPLLRDLDDIVCAGATGGTGTNGRTKIRIAQTSMHGDRGKAIAERLRTMWQRGCDIKIVYAVFGNNVLQILRNTSRGPVPIKQIAQDFNLDGVYDRYLHMKTMAVSGHYRGNTAAQVTWNGSANWTSVALASDEIVMRIFDGGVRKQYADWVDYLYAHPPKYSNNPVVQDQMETRSLLARRSLVARGGNPYAGIQVN